MIFLNEFSNKFEEEQHLLDSLIGDQSEDPNEDTETGEHTVNCDYYATLDGPNHDCWRLDENCCLA